MTGVWKSHNLLSVREPYLEVESTLGVILAISKTCFLCIYVMFFVLYLADQIIVLEMHTILVAKLVSFKKYKKYCTLGLISKKNRENTVND